jgi:hypothetical protein
MFDRKHTAAKLAKDSGNLMRNIQTLLLYRHTQEFSDIV